jgi:hypothetical protein
MNQEKKKKKVVKNEVVFENSLEGAEKKKKTSA